MHLNSDTQAPNSDTQIRNALLQSSHFLQDWKDRKMAGKVIILGYKNKIIGVQYNTNTNEIIRYFDIPKINFEPSHLPYLTPIEQLPDWILSALESWQDGWKSAISTIQNDTKAAVPFEQHYTLSGSYLSWVDVDFKAPSDWLHALPYMRVQLSNRWRISSQLQTSLAPEATYLEDTMVELIRAAEANQWAILQELFKGEFAYALHSETEWVIWHNEIPYHINIQNNDGNIELLSIEDWSGASRGFGINPWPNSILEDLATHTVYKDERKQLRPVSESLRTQIHQRLSTL